MSSFLFSAGTTPSTTIRLRGPDNLRGVGVVQVFRQNAWSTVCDNNWGFADARVVCRALCYK